MKKTSNKFGISTWCGRLNEGKNDVMKPFLCYLQPSSRKKVRLYRLWFLLWTFFLYKNSRQRKISTRSLIKNETYELKRWFCRSNMNWWLNGGELWCLGWKKVWLKHMIFLICTVQVFIFVSFTTKCAILRILYLFIPKLKRCKENYYVQTTLTNSRKKPICRKNNICKKAWKHWLLMPTKSLVKAFIKARWIIYRF